jgi:serine phosphatase RsbU (regulator of sigma subunit)
MVALEPGDLFCFHTDGIIESRASDGRLFGRDGLDASLRGTLERDGLATLDELANGVVTDLIGYMKDPYFEDDITLLLVRLAAGDR